MARSTMDKQQDPLQPLRHALRHPKVLAADGWYTHEDDRFAATDREFIAACQPSVIAGLLAERDELSRRLDHIIHDHHAVRAEAQSRVDRAVMRALAAENDRDEARADRLRAEDISSTLATDFACALAPTLSAIMSTAPEAQPGRGDVKPASPCRCGPDGCSDSVSCPRNGGAA